MAKHLAHYKSLLKSLENRFLTFAFLLSNIWGLRFSFLISLENIHNEIINFNKLQNVKSHFRDENFDSLKIKISEKNQTRGFPIFFLNLFQLIE